VDSSSHRADNAPAELGKNAATSGIEAPVTPAQAEPETRDGEERGGGANGAAAPEAEAAVPDLWADAETKSAMPEQPAGAQLTPRRDPARFAFGENAMKVLKLPDLLKAAAEPEQIVYAGLEIGEIGLVLSAPGLSKSTLCLGIGASVSSGAEYLGYKPGVVGPVMVVCVEDKPSRIARRIIAAAKAMGASKELIQKNLHVVKSTPPFRLFRRAADTVGVGMTPEAFSLLGKVKALGVRLLIIDPLVEIHNASENENGSMHAVMDGLRVFAIEGACAVLVAHHVSRPEEKATIASSRGAGAVTAAARFGLVLNDIDKAAAKRFAAMGIDAVDLLQVEIGKFNHGRRSKEPMILRRREVMVGPFPTPVLEMMTPDGESER
jgi:hypothetical protein